MKVLGIESSCDETAVAIIGDDKTIYANVIHSQRAHALYGGVVPEVAARAHASHMDYLVDAALQDANMILADIDAIAVTAGPGLIGGVMVGAMTAKAIAAVRKIPIVAVNHLEGHALTARLTDDVAFPYLLLLVSGGHSQLLIVKGVGDYERLGATIDDALGEAFDKTAKLLGLGYPGGPAVEKMAAACTDPKRAMTKFPLPRPLIGQDHCDFSFSGLKTAVKRAIDAYPDGRIPKQDVEDLCFAFQETIAAVLQDRLKRGIARYLAQHPASPSIVVAGGVAANMRLRRTLEELAAKNGLRFVAPPLKLCTDNAAMIAWAGIEKLKLGQSDHLDFPVYPRWPLDKNQTSKK